MVKSETAGKAGRWAVLLVAVLLLIIVPYMIWGAQIDGWTAKFVEAGKQRPELSALVLGGLLASDILLPIPSSIVSTACGLMLGLVVGALTSLVGMVISCGLGYWLGRVFGRPVAAKLVGAKDLDNFEGLSSRFGQWALVIARPVPVLAEVSVLFAGVSRMPFGRYMFITSLSNLGISVVYAAIGAYAAELNSFLIAFLAGICVPGLIMLIAKRFRRY